LAISTLISRAHRTVENVMCENSSENRGSVYGEFRFGNFSAIPTLISYDVSLEFTFSNTCSRGYVKQEPKTNISSSFEVFEKCIAIYISKRAPHASR